MFSTLCNVKIFSETKGTINLKRKEIRQTLSVTIVDSPALRLGHLRPGPRPAAARHTGSARERPADDPGPYTIHGDKNIHRALSLVPQEVLNFFDLDVELYLKDQQIRDFDHQHRALSHAQIEILAGRVSSLNGCFY